MKLRSLSPSAVALTALLSAFAPARALAVDDSCGDLLMVLDRSGSMVKCTIDGMTKEAIAKNAIKTVVTKYPTVAMGLFVFPDTLAACPGNGCVAGKEVVPVAADGAMTVASWVNAMPPSCGGTPTGPTMEKVKDYMKFTNARKHYVLLLTDGVPTCEDGDTPGDGGVKMCNGGGCEECKNPYRVYDSIKALYDRGIHTFVIGFDADKADCGDPLPTCPNGAPPGPLTLNPDTLNKMAELGGEPVAGPKKYYSANDPTSLNDALMKILGKVKGGTIGSCETGDADGGADGGGAGGGGAGGGGGGAGGGMDAAGGQGGEGGEGGEGGDGGSSGRGASGSGGCLCTAGGAAPGLAMAAVAALGLVLARARRRRG